MNTKEIIALLREQKHEKVKVAIIDIDGVARGKFMSKNKFISALESEFGFCEVVFGWDMNDACYDNVKITGWHTGYGDLKAKIDPATIRTIPWEDDVPFFNIKKLFNSIIGIVIYLIFCFFIIPIIFVGLNFAIYGKMVGPISAVGGSTIINLTIFGFANRNIASNSNRNITNAFWLGFLGPLGLVICLFNSVKLAQKKISLGILRFFIFAIAIQLLGELGIISNGGKGLLIYFFGFTSYDFNQFSLMNLFLILILFDAFFRSLMVTHLVTS